MVKVVLRVLQGIVLEKPILLNLMEPIKIVFLGAYLIKRMFLFNRDRTFSPKFCLILPKSIGVSANII